MGGSAKNVMARFEPICDDMNENMNVPTIAPKEDMEEIHDSCSLVIGPVISGVVSEKSMGKAGLSHPMMHP